MSTSVCGQVRSRYLKCIWECSTCLDSSEVTRLITQRSSVQIRPPQPNFVESRPQLDHSGQPSWGCFTFRPQLDHIHCGSLCAEFVDVYQLQNTCGTLEAWTSPLSNRFLMPKLSGRFW